MSQQKEVTKYTAKKQKTFLGENHLDITDKRDFEDADRGLIARLGESIKSETGDVWSPRFYSFLRDEDDAPDTVNPSLWRQAKLNARHGLYLVKDGIWQVRGYDVANITFIRGRDGYIVIDTLTNVNAARACVKLFFDNLPPKPITGIIYTHSHADHWGGVAGAISKEEAASRQIPIIAPDRFMEKAVSENVLAGSAMLRRGAYMFGTHLEKNERGNVDAGLGKSSGGGEVSLIAPTQIIKQPVETHTIDGVEFVFQLTPETEAPSEMTVFLPGYKAFCPAELCNQIMHNIYTIRGAETRDAKAWAGYINDAIHEYGGKFDVVFATHNWPVWGEEEGIDYLKKQRDIYKFIHDQTLRLANAGYTMNEIAELIKLPKELSETWSVRGNYGSLSHNAKAVYNRYLGYYDANPATINELPQEQAAKKYVEYFGGAKTALEKAQKDFENGEYRFAAQALRHLVLADPKNRQARELLADTFEQLGYAAESAPWRNAYLTGALELREGVKKNAGFTNMGVLSALSIRDLFDLLSVRLNAKKAEGKKFAVNFDFTDINEQYALYLENSTLNYRKGKREEQAAVSLTITKDGLLSVFSGQAKFAQLAKSGAAKVTGNPLKLVELTGLLEQPNPSFNIVLP